MSLAARERLLAGLLAFVAAWPLAQRALVARHGVDAWKLGGFAMYATPRPRLDMSLYELRDGSELPLSLLPGWSAPLEWYRARREALGELAPPDELARRVLEARPDIQGVAVVIDLYRLSPETAMFDGERRVYRFDRRALAAER